ncbi:MAG: regulatory protein RecX [Coriobacteriia bacterium]|nr:regulatory protein RecX [Coriobacteriia bacterium]
MDTHNEITAIRTRRGSKRREVDLDGAVWLTVPKPVLAGLGLSSGDIVDPDDVIARVAELEPSAARERSLRLLAYRDRSEAEMRSKLTDDGYSSSTVDQAVQWLLDTGLLDDERFAEQLARSLIVGRRYGRTRSLRYLQRTGILDEIARQALDAVAPEEHERDRTLVLARSLYRTGDNVERLASRLVRRGYTPSDSLTCARTVIADAGSADGTPLEGC